LANTSTLHRFCTRDGYVVTSSFNTARRDSPTCLYACGRAARSVTRNVATTGHPSSRHKRGFIRTLENSLALGFPGRAQSLAQTRFLLHKRRTKRGGFRDSSSTTHVRPRPANARIFNESRCGPNETPSHTKGDRNKCEGRLSHTLLQTRREPGGPPRLHGATLLAKAHLLTAGDSHTHHDARGGSAKCYPQRCYYGPSIMAQKEADKTPGGIRGTT